MAFPADPLGLTVELDAVAGVLLTEDFEGASPLDNFDAQSAGRVTVQAGSLRNGAAGVELAPAGNTAFLRWRERLWRDGAASYPFWSARFYTRFPGSLPGTPPPSIFSCITVGSVDDFTFFYNVNSGTWRWDLDQNASADGPTVVADQWYLVEAKGDYSTDNWSAQVRINGIEYDEVGVFGNGAEVVHNGVWGVATSLQTWTADLDDFAMAVADHPLGFLGPPPGTRTWSDITDLVYGRDDINITRGRSDEGQEVDRSTCSLTANNRDGALSPRNPTSPFYGEIGRNTPLRVRLDNALPKYLLLAGAHDSNASADPPQTEAGTDDSALLSITGDIDLRIDIQPDSWDLFSQGLCNKYLTTGDERAWLLWLNTDGTLSFSWSDDGTLAGVSTETSTAAVTVPASGRLALRVTLDVNNGASGYDVDFYTAPDIDGSWTQLGATVTGGATTSIFDSTAQVEIGRAHTTISGTIDGDLRGRVYAFQLLDGIAGDLVADVRFDSMTEAGETSFVDGLDNEWTLLGDTSIVDPAVRFFGEVSEWPSKWDLSGSDVYVPMQASGVLRRLQQGSSPLQSTLRRGYTNATFTPKAYWPCEDLDGATQIASALPGGKPMRFLGGTPELEANTDFDCSTALPTVSESQWTGGVANYASTGEVQVWFLMKVPAAGAVNGEGIIHVRTLGTVTRWRILYGTGGTLTFQGHNAEGDLLVDSGAAAFDVDGKLLRVSIELTQNGSGIDWDLAILEVGADFGTETFGTEASSTLGRCHAIVINPGGELDDVVIGHISVHDEVRSLFDLWEELDAYDQERAGPRIQRLCEEEGLTFRGLGDLQATAQMGPQTAQQLVTLLRECGAADGGILYEPRDLYGIGYRTRDSMLLQDPRLTLDYDSQHLSSIEPVDDDQQLRNDVTVTRTGGSSARVLKEDGPLSIEAPPDGIGRYDAEVTLNLAFDGQLPNMAGWKVHLGTVDQERYPQLAVELARDGFVDDQDLAQAAQDLDIGDRLTVTDPPAWLPPDTISQLAQGFTEVLGTFTHRITVNCSPERPWAQAARWGEEHGFRYASTGTSTLLEDIDSTQTDLVVTTAVEPRWTHDDGDYDIAVGGEVMTVTNIGTAEGFEDGTLEWTFTGDWTRSQTQAHGGTWSFKAAEIADSELSETVLTLPANAETIRFWYRVSSEDDFDNLDFLIDAAIVLRVNGEVDWTQSDVYDISAATTVTFRYEKDSSASDGDDTAWIDDVTITFSGDQDFTVTRSVNGVVKSHRAGDAVELALPPVYVP